MSQMELFTTKLKQTELVTTRKKKPGKKPRSIWDVPPAERRIDTVSRLVCDLLREQEDAQIRAFNARQYMAHLLEDLRGRDDIWPLITKVYWYWERFVGEEDLAKMIGVSVDVLRAKIEPEPIDVRCVSCDDYFIVQVRTRDDSRRTHSGELRWDCESCGKRSTGPKVAVTREHERERGQVIPMPSRRVM